MTPASPYLNREEQAMREIGQTNIRRATAWVLVAVFLAVICAVPLIQQVHDMRAHLAGERVSAWPQCYDIFRRVPTAFAVLVHPPGSPTAYSPMARIFAANRQLLREMHACEDALEDEAIIGQKIRPPVQYVLSRWLGTGNEKAYCGVRPWLFYRADVDYLTGPGFLNPVQLAHRAAAGNEWTPSPQPDPRPAILQFRDQLAERGIALIVMPVPCKPAIQPGQFSAGCAGLDHPLQNPSFEAFKQDLAENGVQVFDCATMLVKRKPATGKPQYLETDTHWQPETMEFVAEQMKALIQARVNLPDRPLMNYQRGRQTVSNQGDLAVMLKLLPSQTYYAAQTVVIHPVFAQERNPWRPDIAADVLVLGDSFCNIYSLVAMGWGENAGLIEQLSFALQRPMDRLVINDNGAYATRALLARELARGRDRLAGKRLVIWQFAMRELAAGDWKSVTLILGKPAPDRFVVLATGKDLIARGVVRTIAPVPRPGTVPYKDHIMAAHIVDLETSQPAIRGNQALVYFQSMRDNGWTPAARLRPGDSVTMRLRPWLDMAPRYERINRTELPDDALQLTEPCWGELISNR